MTKVQAQHPSHWISQNLSNGSTHNAIGNYAGAVEQFTWAPGNNFRALIHRMIVLVEDAGAFDANKYGNGIVLTNGISVYVRDGDDAVVANLTPTIAPVKTNAEWGALCFDVDVKEWGTGNEILLVRWTFERAGIALLLDGDEGHYISVELNDTYVNLVQHRFLIQGYYI